MVNLLGLTLGARLYNVICPKHLWRGHRIKETLRTINACMEESTKQRQDIYCEQTRHGTHCSYEHGTF